MISERIDEGHDGRPQGPSPRIHAAPAPTRETEHLVRVRRLGFGQPVGEGCGKDGELSRQSDGGRPQGPQPRPYARS